MNNKRWLLLMVALVALVATAVVALWSSKPESVGTPALRVKKKVPARRSNATHWEPYSPLVDAPDPRGTLRLEGQVVDGQDHGVDKATVTINANPPRTTVTEGDGSFVFENLIARVYKLRARAGTMVGGPIKHQVKAEDEPVIIRMRPGVTLEVSIVASKDQQPIAKATVAVDRRQLPTNSAGKATFEGVSPGYVVLAARAKQYGSVQQLFEVPEGKRRISTKLSLSRGAAVTGVVNDDKGHPVAGAKVRAYDMSDLLQLGSSPLSFVETDDSGRFTISGVSRGTYRVVAHTAGFPAAQSPPLALDGVNDRAGIVITLQTGATLAGRVIDKDGSPVASATIKVTLKSGSFGGSAKFRRTVTDQRGGFKLVGLPRRQIEALAFSAHASSEGRRFDLRRGDVRDATFQLKVSGQISGSVVDDAGQPVAEARVTATGDFWGGAKVMDLKLRGSAEVMTDGGGGFRFNGLPEGKYQLRASRTMRQATRLGPGGVSAKTGDTAVRIVLRADGGAKGVVRFKDRSPATVYTVNLGYPPTVPVAASNGAFTIASMRPGKYDVTFNGATFAPKTVRNVEIAPGRVTDMGNVTVDAGRSIKGRVLSAEGSPMANAAVVLGSRIVGDGANLALELGTSIDQTMSLRRAATKKDGTFVIRAVGSAAYVIAAEHPEYGRSKTVAMPAGTEDAFAELRLSPFGSVEGVVKVGGAPGRNLTVVATSGSGKQVVVVHSGNDGRYSFERLPAGRHTLTAMAGQGATASTGSQQVVVAKGRSVRADITIDVGEIDLSVMIVPETGKIDATQVFLFPGKVNVATGGEINRVFLAESKKGGAKMAFAAGGKSAAFAKIRQGQYSICAIPITGNMNDPVFAKRLQAHAEKLKVYCRPHTVAKTPVKQSVSLTLPPMEPLP